MLPGAIDVFLLAFPALLSIINPVGGAFTFLAITGRASDAERAAAARAIAIYGFVLLNVSLYIGAYVLEFFGVSLPVLRVGGGAVVAATAWKLLHADDPVETEAPASAPPADLRRLAFYPLTMPITTGPGTISVAIALGTSRPAGVDGFAVFALAATLATLANCALIYVCYRYADRVAARFGPTGTAIVMRLSAFLLLCIGLQVLWTGASELLGSVPRP